MTSTTQYNMAPFIFPDPTVSTTVVNPNTGDTWIFQDGVWMVGDSADIEITPTESDTSTCDTVTIAALRCEISGLRADIIQLRAQLTAATVNNFLILE